MGIRFGCDKKAFVILMLCAYSCLQLCTNQVSALPTVSNSDGARREISGAADSLGIKFPKADGDDDDGLSTMDYVWIGVGCLAAVIIVSCLIAYCFCECVKTIICLPCKCLCCCCD